MLLKRKFLSHIRRPKRLTQRYDSFHSFILSQGTQTVEEPESEEDTRLVLSLVDEAEIESPQPAEKKRKRAPKAEAAGEGSSADFERYRWMSKEGGKVCCLSLLTMC